MVVGEWPDEVRCLVKKRLEFPKVMAADNRIHRDKPAFTFLEC